MKKLLVLTTAIFSVCAMANTDKANEKLAENFGYAMQASGNCSDLNMRLDTAGKVEKLLGEDPTSKESKYNEFYSKGLVKANKDKNLCVNAWKKFGCQGSETARLLQTNPFTNKTGEKCTFN